MLFITKCSLDHSKVFQLLGYMYAAHLALLAKRDQVPKILCFLHLLCLRKRSLIAARRVCGIPRPLSFRRRQWAPHDAPIK
jgi:hypothetical protein